MCGISVLLSKEWIPDAESIVQRMNQKIAHRGPDDSGVYTYNNVTLGHRRLSILDLSKAGHQPMHYKGRSITYNGEIYNYIELRDELKAKGYEFASDTDTEVILAAYDCWGKECLSRFNGMWAFCLLDPGRGELFFARDRFGIKPLNYCISNKWVAAASEIKQFMEVPDFDPAANMNKVYEYLVNGVLHTGEQTFFDNVYELPGGHHLVYDLSAHRYEITKWYELDPSIQSDDVSYGDACDSVHHFLKDSIRLRQRSDVPLGSCLSGGIDSSAIACLLWELTGSSSHTKTVTSCYADKRYDEQQYSDAVSNLTKFDPIKVYPDLNDMLNKNHWDDLVYYQDQPILTASYYSEYNVFKAASENGLKVMLDGQGADEYFGGYAEFFLQKQYDALKGLRWIDCILSFKEKLKGGNISAYTEFRNFTDFLTSISPRSLFGSSRNHSSANYFLDEARSQRPANSYASRYRHESFRSLSVAEINEISIPHQLHSEDRNSMRFSVESRLPFLDYRLVEYVLSLPTNFKIKRAKTKSVLRDAIPSMPHAIKNRTDKMGFVAPDEQLFNHNASAIREEMNFAKTMFSDFLDTDRLLNDFETMATGRGPYNPVFFRIISLAKWAKVFKVKF